MKTNLLMMLSGLAARILGRGRRRPPPARIASWYESTSLGDWCGPDTHCAACGADGDCDPCDTIDGRRMDEIAEHAQTCDGCGNLTENESLTRNPSADLLYCRRCHAQGAGEEWAYKVWECGCGEAAVYTDLDLGHQDCPGCGEPMTSEWPSTEETLARHRARGLRRSR